MMTTKQLQVADGVLAYDDNEQAGELIVLVPGMGDLRSEYRFIVPVLNEAGYRVVTVDLRGHGESSANWPEYSIRAVGQDILALIEHLDAGPATVVGTSFSPGSMVWAAVEKPELISKLVLICPFVRDPKINPAMKLLVNVMMSGPWKVWAWGMFYKSLYPTQTPPDFADYQAKLKANLSEPGRYEAVKGLGQVSKADAEARLTRVTQPSLVIMGDKDPDFSPPEAEAKFAAEKLGGRYEMIAGAGHYPQAEMPDKVIPILLKFLREGK
ncbi:alpha/beta hydrolase [Anaerolineales bacterium HSG25]|nr:alpha/beta hydrolase [Anaerolineales bacterium HSG25]